MIHSFLHPKLDNIPVIKRYFLIRLLLPQDGYLPYKSSCDKNQPEVTQAEGKGEHQHRDQRQKIHDGGGLSVDKWCPRNNVEKSDPGKWLNDTYL